MSLLIPPSQINVNCDESTLRMVRSPEYQRLVELTLKRRRLDMVLEELTSKRENETSDNKKKLLDYLVSKYIPRTLHYYNRTIESIVNGEHEINEAQSEKVTGDNIELIKNNLDFEGETARLSEYPAYLSTLFIWKRNCIALGASWLHRVQD